jgi:hypothetical protein
MTNVACIICVLLVALALKESIVLFILFMFAGPVHWYIKWSHPECMIYCMMLISLMLMYRKQFLGAAVFAAICALQQVFFIVWVGVLLLMHYFSMADKRKIVDVRILLIILLASASPIFYLWNFGTPTLIGKYYADFSYITIRRVFEYFFDLNFGLFIFLPGTLIALFIIGIMKRFTVSDALIGGFVISFAVFSATTLNWNSGMALISRYSFLSIPPLAYLVYLKTKNEIRSFIFRIALIAAVIILNSAVFLYFSTNKYEVINWSPLAKMALRNFPAWYNPDPETFIERTQHFDGWVDPKAPVIYADFPSVKILVNEKTVKMIDISQLPAASVESTSVWFSTAKHKEKDFVYYNLKLDSAKIEKFLVEKCTPGIVGIIPWWPKFAGDYPLSGSFSLLTFIVNKTSDVVGGAGTSIVYSTSKTLMQTEKTIGMEIPAIQPGSFGLVVQMIKNIHPYFVNSLTFQIEQRGRFTHTQIFNAWAGNQAALDLGKLSGGKFFDDSDYHSMIKIEQVDNTKGSDHSKITKLLVTIRNLGYQPWPSKFEIPNFKGAVRIGIEWLLPTNLKEQILQQRIDLPHAMFPGDEVQFQASLNPVDRAGKVLASGNYIVTFGMVQEGIRWFKQKGDSVVSIPIVLK